MNAPKQMPKLSLAKQQKDERQMLNEAKREHGKTTPHKLEHRRKAVTGYIFLIDKSIKSLQAAKKVFKKNGEDRIKAYMTQRDIEKKKFTGADFSEYDAETESVIASMTLEINMNICQFEKDIANLVGQMANAEVGALIFDAVAIRSDAVGMGKKGLIRWPIAGFAHDIAGSLETLIIIQKRLAAKIGVDVEDLVDDEDDGEEVDAEEIVSAEEAAKLEKGEGLEKPE